MCKTSRLICITLLLAGCTHTKPTTKPTAPAPTPPQEVAIEKVWRGNYHLHLPGIGGYRNIDRRLIRGLAEGGLDGQIDHYDWTVADPGLGALLARQRNNDEANNVAQIILEHYRANPAARITLSAHSGGAGIITWALEKLPADVTVDSIALLAPALSPTYDMSKALAHVRGRVYVFYSPHDIAVLGIGTSLFGTIDGVKTDAAGKVGFVKPKSADPQQYKKLVQFPYDQSWMKLENLGDHIGTMNRPFGREVIAPLLRTGQLPPALESIGRRHPATTVSAAATDK